jgi:hypothetical protein
MHLSIIPVWLPKLSLAIALYAVLLLYGCIVGIVALVRKWKER